MIINSHFFRHQRIRMTRFWFSLIYALNIFSSLCSKLPRQFGLYSSVSPLLLVITSALLMPINSAGIDLGYAQAWVHSFPGQGPPHKCFPSLESGVKLSCPDPALQEDWRVKWLVPRNSWPVRPDLRCIPHHPPLAVPHRPEGWWAAWKLDHTIRATLWSAEDQSGLKLVSGICEVC